jgi:hypothetical protein
LRVPPPEPWNPPGSLHIWFLADDDPDLVRRLVDGGAVTLQRFQKVKDTLVAAGVITNEETERTLARAEVWGAWLEGWRTGRARPVTREFLAESAAVSKAHLEQVTTVLEKYQGDGARLLEAIAAKEIKRFQSAKLELLRQELADADLLDPRPPLTDEELFSHILDRVAPLLAAGLLDTTKVRTLALTFANLVAEK